MLRGVVVYLLQQQQCIVLTRRLAWVQAWQKLNIWSKKEHSPHFPWSHIPPFLLTLPLSEAPKRGAIIRIGIIHRIFLQIQCNFGCVNCDWLLIYCVLIMILSLHTELSCLDECRLLPCCAVFLSRDHYRLPGYCVGTHIFLCRVHN